MYSVTLVNEYSGASIVRFMRNMNEAGNVCQENQNFIGDHIPLSSGNCILYPEKMGKAVAIRLRWGV